MQQTVILYGQKPAGSFGSKGRIVETSRKLSACDLGACQTSATQRESPGWIKRIARAIGRTAGMETRLALAADRVASHLSKGRVKRLYLAKPAMLSCLTGKVWITLDGGGQDIVLGARESKSFGPGDGIVVEGLAASRISVEYL